MIRFWQRKTISFLENGNIENQMAKLLEYYSVESNRDTTVVFVDNEEKVMGWADWPSFVEKRVITDYLELNSDFWSNAKDYFSKQTDKDCLVVDKNQKLITFCYSDKKAYTGWYETLIRNLEKRDEETLVSFRDIFPEIEEVCIIGLNEFAWRIYNILRAEEVAVVVKGQEWKWFGVKGCDTKVTSYHKMAYIYAEGNEFVRSRNSSLEIAFSFVLQWGDMHKRRFYIDELKRLQQCGGKVYTVSIPFEINASYRSRNELLNILLPLPNPIKLCSSEEGRIRQLDFFGKNDFELMRKGERFDKKGWETIFHNIVSGEKIEGVYFKNKIYLMGPCILSGYWTSVENSVVSYLQNLVTEYEYEVVRVFVPRTELRALKYALKNLPIRKSDMLICIDVDYIIKSENFENLDLCDLYNRPREETWFYDSNTAHTNGCANKAIAHEIFDKCLRKKLEETGNTENGWIQMGEFLSDEQKRKVTEYIDKVVDQHNEIGNRVGAVVMNCNPFTKGHLFLIESAAKEVDLLYIFVVEEDKSYFPFEARIELVNRGTSHLKNVKVIPSGQFVVSYETMSAYFEKVKKQEVRVDLSNDIEIFARYIAPQLGITRRFVGEEPIDFITRQYNEQMAEFFPQYGIEFVEIPRENTLDEQVISASKVRRLLQEGKWKESKQFVPQTTYEFLGGMSKLVNGNRFVIYGAGDVGRIIYRNLQGMNANVVGWLDKKYRNVADKIPIEDPKELGNKEFEYIIVAVKTEKVFLEIYREIVLMIGDSAEKKIIGPVYSFIRLIELLRD
ncbi:MAG: adenylyltransferase/cytidyltransferase family protein [Lachnospiraceae bacterium]|nr:adenylyltransferase/cytidyltransferase family protein [Lachnospiraceae bacterium]